MDRTPASQPLPAATRAQQAETLGFVQVLCLLLMFLGLRYVFGGLYLESDATFVNLRSGMHLAEGKGLSFDPFVRQAPKLLTSSPGFASAVGLLVGLGIDPLVAGRVLGLLGEGLVLLGALSLLRWNRRRGALFLLLAALPWPLIQWSREAPDGALFAGLALCAFVQATARRGSWCGLFGAACLMLRAEGLLVVLLTGAMLLSRPRSFLAWMVPVLGLGVLFMEGLRRAFGSTLGRAYLTLRPEERAWPWPGELGQVVLWVLVFGGLLLGLRVLRLRVLMIGGALLLVLSVWLSARQVNPLFECACVCGLLGVAGGLPMGGPRRSWALLLTVLTCFSCSMVVLSKLRPRVDWNQELFEPLAAWSGEIGADRGARAILTRDPGLIGFATGALVLDPEGLVWPPSWVPGDLLGAIEETEVDVLVLRVDRAQLGELQSDPWLAQSYMPARRVGLSGTFGLAPLQSAWGRTQYDWLVLERLDARRAAR